MRALNRNDLEEVGFSWSSLRFNDLWWKLFSWFHGRCNLDRALLQDFTTKPDDIRFDTIESGNWVACHRGWLSF
jgi:hypothetical protein